MPHSEKEDTWYDFIMNIRAREFKLLESMPSALILVSSAFAVISFEVMTSKLGCHSVLRRQRSSFLQTPITSNYLFVKIIRVLGLNVRIGLAYALTGLYCVVGRNC